MTDVATVAMLKEQKWHIRSTTRLCHTVPLPQHHWFYLRVKWTNVNSCCIISQCIFTVSLVGDM